MNTTAIVIPAHNEANRISSVLERLQQYHDDIIVVNDGSEDATLAMVKSHGVTLLSHAVNLGKGAALKTGIEYAITRGYTAVILMDADGQHDPGDIPSFLSALEKSDLILGFRRLSTRNSIIRFAGNKFDELLISLLYGVTVRDPICGYRALRTRIYDKLRWSSDGYEVETEMVVNAIKRKISFLQIEVETKYLDYYKGVSILNAWKIVIDVIKWRLIP